MMEHDLSTGYDCKNPRAMSELRLLFPLDFMQPWSTLNGASSCWAANSDSRSRRSRSLRWSSSYIFSSVPIANGKGMRALGKSSDVSVSQRLVGSWPTEDAAKAVAKTDLRA